VEKQQNSLRFCSACAGDYENPDRFAWNEELNEDEQLSETGREEQGSAARHEP
jgi:hypothetical protein